MFWWDPPQLNNGIPNKIQPLIPKGYTIRIQINTIEKQNFRKILLFHIVVI